MNAAGTEQRPRKPIKPDWAAISRLFSLLYLVLTMLLGAVLIFDLARFVEYPSLLISFSVAIVGGVMAVGVGYLRMRAGQERNWRLAALPFAITLLAWLGDILWLVGIKTAGIYFGPLLTIILASFMGRSVMAAGVLVLARNGRRLRVGLILLIVCNLFLSGLLVYGTVIEPFNLQVSRVTLQSDKLPVGYRLRIVQLSDLHMERITDRERAMVKLVNDASADLLLTTGDYLNTSFITDPITHEDVRSVFRQMHAQYGTVVIAGTVEWDVNTLKRLFAGTDVDVMINRAEVKEIRGQRIVIGATPSRDPMFAAVRRSIAAQGGTLANYRILLTHKPEDMDVAQSDGYDLYLAGHTHGGQIALPFYGALTTLSKYGKKYEQGLYHEGNTYFYVNRGIGMEGNGAPRIRFLAPPEVTIIDVVGTGK